jgi:hypothetical protein
MPQIPNLLFSCWVFLTVQPNDDTAFRAAVTPVCATNNYNSYKLSVTAARNSKAWF